MVVALRSQLASYALTNQRVLVRADLNVPIKNCTIINDHRLRALVPTIDLIRRKGGKIILATHIGRPTCYTADLSTSLLIPWFQDHGYTIDYQPDLERAYQATLDPSPSLVLLENMRFFPGEKNHDPVFVELMARLGDYYVNDAFALEHRTDSSITDVPARFAADKRTIGLLVAHELTMLNKLLDHPPQPWTLILGGGKVADKLPLLYALVDTATTILLGPAIVCTFLKALAKPVGKSLVDDQLLGECLTFLDRAQRKGVKVPFPIDYCVAHGSFYGRLSICDADQVPDDAVIVSIGPKTANLFAPDIEQAKTVFYNGLMGDSSRPETWDGSNALFNAMAQSSGFTVIGGGDSVAIAQLLGYSDKIGYLSTGGGATLTYLAGKALPGLEIFGYPKISDKNLTV